MFGTFFRFEIRYWLTGMMVWVFLFVLGAMFFGASSTDQITVGAALENTYRNAPFVVENYYSFAGILALLMTTAFMNAAATREFSYQTHQIVFSTPIDKWSFLIGRFWGAALIAVIPLLSVSAGNILAGFMPWRDAVRWGDIPWSAHLWGVLCFAIPNTLFAAAILFAVGVLARSTIASFLSALVLMVAYGISSYLTDKLENEPVAAMLDPFGIRAFGLLTKYWTVADKNTLVLKLEGLLLWNRVLWLGVAAVVFAAAGTRFTFSERSARKRKAAPVEDLAPKVESGGALPSARPDFSQSLWSKWFASSLRLEFLSLVKSTVFLVLLAAALANVLPSLMFNAREAYGNTSLPVTYQVIGIIRGTLYLFIVSILAFFSGALIWKERDSRCDEIHDALPVPNWIPFLSKFLSLLGAVALIELLAVLVGIGVQTYHGYTRYQLGLYLSEVFFWDFLTMVFLASLAFFCHVVSPNKYVGYFVFIALMIANAFGWGGIDVESHLVQFASTPSYTYSDLYHYGPFLAAVAWFNLYWFLFSVLLAIVAILLWQRGKETGAAIRLAGARLAWTGVVRGISVVVLALFLAVGAWAFYNTKVRNELVVDEQRKVLQAEYERKYKKFASLAQPRTQSVKYWIDVEPATPAATMKGEQVLKNVSSAPLSELHLNLAPRLDTTIEVERARLKSEDKIQRYRIYEIQPPLNPGDAITMRYTVAYRPKGFENELSVREVVQNGTFFNNQIAPQIGYDPGRELSEKNDRRKKGLPEKDLMPALERDCTAHCMSTYLDDHSDWVSVETIISTAPDQIAVAPGSLQREWSENGKRYFHYVLDHPSMNFYSFISARYQVAREDWNGVKLEVYYHPEHPWNVPKMMRSIRKSLEYFTANFGPYRHKQARIIEFPRVASFAQAFPGTMPYSEAIGFIADLGKPDDIDQVYYVVAHEMGHQWWAHQVIGARMQGATLLSETLAQYSALMVMEKEYGRDMMRKFLAYEADRYLRARGRELLKERPLMKVESSQGYIHYQKGSLVMYYMKEMIGEEAVNRALRKVINRYAYAAPPYPTSHVLVDALRDETPENLRYLLQDLFEDITLFSNRTVTAESKARAGGGFDVTIEVESRKFKANETGAETEVPVDDFIEIGAFAKPAEGKQYGKTLYRERIRINAQKNRFTFQVGERPEKAGIDPFSLLVDRVPDDNLKKVDLK